LEFTREPALQHCLNNNMVFHWRRRLGTGLLDQ
jgi:hypothetical protein